MSEQTNQAMNNALRRVFEAEAAREMADWIANGSDETIAEWRESEWRRLLEELDEVP